MQGQRMTTLTTSVGVLQVAYKQNGRWLEPDHGFPVRMIIPGHIGGRMVKWLKVCCSLLPSLGGSLLWVGGRRSACACRVCKQTGWGYACEHTVRNEQGVVCPGQIIAFL